MRLLGTRRATLVAGVATVAAVALTGCSAGQVAETALKKPSNMGVNTDTADGSIAIRNLTVIYQGPSGYPAGGDAPLEVFLSNQTTAPIVVTITSRPDPAATAQDPVVSGRMVALAGSGSGQSAEPSAAPEPSGSRPAASPDNVEPSSGAPVEPSASVAPAAPAGQPARITVPPNGYQSFLPGDPEQVTVMGLTDRLIPGGSVNLVFEFSNGQPALTLRAPMAVPMSPVPRESGNPSEDLESE